MAPKEGSMMSDFNEMPFAHPGLGATVPTSLA